MNFNIDDPLAGILSDGSDDSFFDDDILGKKKSDKLKTAAIPERKKSLFDLELEESKKINKEITIESKSNKIDLNKSSSFKEVPKAPSLKAVSPTPFKKAISKESINVMQGEVINKSIINTSKSPAKSKVTLSTDPLDDILSESNKNKKDSAKPLERGKSSRSILDDILGGSSSPPMTPQKTKQATTKSQDFDLLLGRSDSAVPYKSISGVSVEKINKPKKQDNLQKKTRSSEDWLGVFEGKEDDETTDMPSWLSGETKKKKTDPPPQKEEENFKTLKSQNVPEVEVIAKENTHVDISDKLNSAMTSVIQTNNEDLTAEGAAIYMQQQESQLMVALQLKAQEEKLAVMQMRQKDTQRLQREAALAHHAQLEAMLQRQSEHRLQMQAVINAHQDRITQRIKALLNTTGVEDGTIGPELDEPRAERPDSPHIDLMETSYRRQLAFLEVSLAQSEERMKDEGEKLIKFYSEKIHWLEEHHSLYKNMSADNLKIITERHNEENERLRQHHLDNIKVLQEHHGVLMENIKNAVKQEQNLIQDSTSFSADLQSLVTDVKENKNQFQQLVNRVQNLAENFQKDAERSLQTRETQLSDMIQQLKIDRDNFEKEKVDHKDLVNIFEKRLKQMTLMVEEDSALLKQNKMEFEFEKATFNKQTEFAKNMLKKQNDDIKIIKENIQKEYQENMDKINEEKSKAERDTATISKEKVAVQNLKHEIENMKSELQRQLEEVGEERLKLNLEKQQMHIEEKRILTKSRDLDMLAKAAVEKQQQADKKCSEAEFVQTKYEERIRRIQEHVVSLNFREKQIAKEKVALSRERLSLHNERKKLENPRQCSLCRSAQYGPQYNYESTFPESYLNVSVSRDQGEANVNSAMTAIASEIASLKLNKNFDVNFDGNNVVDDRMLVEENLHTIQTTDTTSGAYREYLDPKFMMLRLDVQQVLNNLDDGNKFEDEVTSHKQ
ncbi:hypothetical protein ACJJTC_003674 [Scirpophaga incertulas]